MRVRGVKGAAKHNDVHLPLFMQSLRSASVRPSFLPTTAKRVQSAQKRTSYKYFIKSI